MKRTNIKTRDGTTKMNSNGMQINDNMQSLLAGMNMQNIMRDQNVGKCAANQQMN